MWGFNNIIQHLNIFNNYWRSSWWFQACFLFNHILDDEWPLCIRIFQAGWSTKVPGFRRMIPSLAAFSEWIPMQKTPSNESNNGFLKNFDILDQRARDFSAILAQTTSSWVKSLKSRWLLHLLIGRTQHDNNLYKWYIYIIVYIYI